MSTARLRYQTIEFGDIDIHIRSLRDNQQFSDPEGVAEKLGISSATWPLFGIVWAAGEILARYMMDVDVGSRRVLEVGCGLGLTSLLLNHKKLDVTATDYHPEAGAFLQINTELNGDSDIPFERTGWADSHDSLGLFDMIIGSDLLYESEHAELLSQFVARHANQCCEIIVVDPGRGHHARFSKKMIELGFEHTQSLSDYGTTMIPPVRAQILRYLRTSTA